MAHHTYIIRAESTGYFWSGIGARFYPEYPQATLYPDVDVAVRAARLAHKKAPAETIEVWRDYGYENERLVHFLLPYSL